MDLKAIRAALEQLEEERGIPREKIVGAIEDALVAAYKKDYAKKSQIVRAKLDMESGNVQFYQVKIAVNDSMLKHEDDGIGNTAPLDEEAVKIAFNEDQHIMLEDARKMKKDVIPGEELIFPLETKEDYGRIAAQTAKQVIIQRLREAEKISVLSEFADRADTVVSGKVQKIERGNVFIDLGRAVGFLPYEEQMPGEHYQTGERIRAYLVSVEETARGVNLRLSRAHPRFLEKLFEIEAPEIANGTVKIEAIAREPGSRTKMAVSSNQSNIDPVGACVGQRGIRVNTVIAELGGEKIDIIEWTNNPTSFVEHALSPAKINKLTLDEENHEATAEVLPDQFSLAVGKRGQNVRLAAKLTGWRIDIRSPEGEAVSGAPEGETVYSKPSEQSAGEDLPKKDKSSTLESNG